MQHYAAFHLGLHCLQKYSFRGSQIQRANNITAHMCFEDNVDPDQLAPNEAILSGSTGSESMPIFEIPEQN